jgi:hypothetical protein
MAHKDKGGYAKKHGPQIKLNPTIAEAVKRASKGDKISCAAAFKVAGRLKVTPGEVGVNIDLLEVSVKECQLGLFGYGPAIKRIKAAETVTPALERAIRESLVKDKLLCLSAWEIAGKFNIAKKEVTSACEALKIKIASCQLGTF